MYLIYYKTYCSIDLKGAWAADVMNTNQWIIADLGSLHFVNGIGTQGRPGAYEQWVTSYKVNIWHNIYALLS